MRFSCVLGACAFGWLVADVFAVRALAREPDVAASVAKLVETIRTTADRRQREQAADELRKVGTPAVAPLGRLLLDPKPEVRAAAAWAIGGMEQGAVVSALPALLAAFGREKDEAVLEALAKAVAKG